MAGYKPTGTIGQYASSLPDGRQVTLSAYSPGPGWTYVGQQIGPMTRSGSNTWNAWAKVSDAPATPSNNGGGGGGGGGGDYSSIISSYQSQIDAANAAAESFRKKAAEDIEALKISLGGQLEEVKASSAAREAELNDLLISQQNAAAETKTLLEGQIASANSAYQEQLRQTQALSNAFVPSLEPTASTAALGDQRQNNTTVTNTKANTLSSLAIISGLGTNANPLAGLQLA